MRPGAPAHLEIGQIEVPRLEKVRLDLLASVIRHDSVFERLDHHAEGFQLLLVALELAAHGFARLVVGLEPLSLVVVHLAQNLLARDRIAVLEEEGEEVEPALGLGHRGIPGLRARARILAVSSTLWSSHPPRPVLVIPGLAPGVSGNTVGLTRMMGPRSVCSKIKCGV